MTKKTLENSQWVPLKTFAEHIGRSTITARKIVLRAGIRRLPGTRWTLNPDDVAAFLAGTLPSTTLSTENKGE